MLPELHPYIDREYSLWLPYVYFALLLFLGAEVAVAVFRFGRKYRANRYAREAIGRISKATLMKDNAEFLKFVALESFSITRSSSGETYPTERWLQFMSDNSTDFTAMPYRLLLDACLQPPEVADVLTADDRKLIIENITRLIRKSYV